MSQSKKESAVNPPLPPAGEGRGEGVWKDKRHTSAIKAKRLRKISTDAENRLWQKIRNRQVRGCKFKRQYPIEHYVADFICVEMGLIVEVDGGQHCENKKDEIRTEFLESKGYEVIRFWNNEVLGNIEGVLDTLTLTLSRKAGEGTELKNGS
jgi:very-short-patch-repair endonuclease